MLLQYEEGRSRGIQDLVLGQVLRRSGDGGSKTKCGIAHVLLPMIVAFLHLLVARLVSTDC